MALANSREMFFIEVPRPDNLISEKIMLATLEICQPSTASEQLIQILSSGKNFQVGIIGKSQAINVITVKRALTETKGKPASGTVALIADSKEQEILDAANTNSNIKLIYANKNVPSIDSPLMEPTGTQVQAKEYPDKVMQLQQDTKSENNHQMNKLLRNITSKPDGTY